jgi:transposase InsO family protein
VLQSYDNDPVAQDLLNKLKADPNGTLHYTLQDGLIRYKGRLWIGNEAELCKRLLHAMHSSAIGGNSGIPVTYRRAKQYFAWPGMKSDIHAFVSACHVCQQAKPDRSKLPSLLRPLLLPEHDWKVVSLDFVEGLPLSEERNCILVVADLFSKYAHFLSLRHPFTAAAVAKLFISQVYRLHGMPSALVSDRDKIFTSALWRELFKLAKVELHMSTAYHPQSDGQTERVNQCLETFLRCFVHACPRQWHQ